MFVFAWLVLVGAFVIRTAYRRTWRLYIGLAIVTVIYLIMLFWVDPWDDVRMILRAIQFRFRLNSYIGYLAVFLVIVGLFVLQRNGKRRIWTLGLALACAVVFVASAWQVWAAPTYQPISVSTRTGTHLPQIDYAKCPAPCPSVETDYQFPGKVQPTVTLPKSVVDIDEARSGSVEFDVPGGQLAAVNVAVFTDHRIGGCADRRCRRGRLRRHRYDEVAARYSGARPDRVPVHVGDDGGNRHQRPVLSRPLPCSEWASCSASDGRVANSDGWFSARPPPKGAQAPSMVQPGVPTTG